MEEDRFDRDLVLVDIASGAQHVLTHNRKDAGSPRWSPGGDRLAFLAAVGPAKEEKAQIFILPMSGGDAAKITRSEEHTSELQSHLNLVCRLLLEKKKVRNFWI